MSPRPVSLLVWRDAKSDPPTGDISRKVLAVTDEGDTWLVRASSITATVMAHPKMRLCAWWAERPVLSDLTDEDVRNIAVWALDGERLTTDGSHDTVDRLRAALGGEKEET